MLRFTSAKLGNGKVDVVGPSKPGKGVAVKHVRFMISQGPVMVEDKGWVTNNNTWEGTAPDGGLQKGAAQALGIAILFKGGKTPSFQTFTWVEQVTLT